MDQAKVILTVSNDYQETMWHWIVRESYAKFLSQNGVTLQPGGKFYPTQGEALCTEKQKFKSFMKHNVNDVPGTIGNWEKC